MREWLEEKDMPKDCATCKYYVLNCSDSYSCIKQNGKAIHPNFSDGMGYRHEDCPFHSLTDYTKQVRKEVCDWIQAEFEDKAKYSSYFDDSGFEINLTEELFLEILSKAQGETK